MGAAGAGTKVMGGEAEVQEGTLETSRGCIGLAHKALSPSSPPLVPGAAEGFMLQWPQQPLSHPTRQRQYSLDPRQAEALLKA